MCIQSSTNTKSLCRAEHGAYVVSRTQKALVSWDLKPEKSTVA